MANRGDFRGGTAAAAAAALSDFKSRSTDEKPAELLKKRLVFLAFLGLGVSIKLAQHRAREVKYNFLAPIITISLAKIVCSLALYARFDGPLSSVIPRLLKVPSVVLRYGAVAGLFCLYDVLSFVNLGIFDPQTYCVLLQLRTVITGAVWEVAFAKRLSWIQRGALALICFACVFKQTKGNFSLEASVNYSSRDYFFIALQVVSNCLAGVCNELLLKSKGGVPLNLQNSVQYAWTILWCVLIGILCPWEGVHLQLFDMQEWSKMTDPRLLPAIVILVVLGLVTSLVLKLLDSVWKAISTALELPITAFASAWVFGYPVHLSDLLALFVAAVGVGVYAVPDLLLRAISRFTPKKRQAMKNIDV